MAIDFPDSPSVGQTVVLGDKTWTWNGTVWNLVTSSGSDHGTLGGLEDDDHTQYLLADGSRSVSGSILPDTDVTYDLGSATYRFRDLYLSGNSIDLGGMVISYDGSNVSMVPDGGSAQVFATEAYVDTSVSDLIGGAPAALDTLNELAAALNDDASYATTITNALAGKLDSSSYTAADVLAKLLTVDGSGSSLDADTLDGSHASAFAASVHTHSYAAASHTHSYLSTSGGTISGSLTATGNIEAQGNLVVTRPDAIMLAGASDNNHTIYSVNAADTGLPWSDGLVLRGYSGWAFYHSKDSAYRMGYRGSNSSSTQYGWYNSNLIVGSAPNDGINTHRLRVQGTGYFTGDVSSGGVWGSSVNSGGYISTSLRHETSDGYVVYGGVAQNSINNTYAEHSSIQFNTDTYWGGVHTLHTGFMITCGGMNGWDTAELSFRCGNNWSSYNSSSALRLKGNRAYFALGPETTYDVYSDGAGRIGYYGSRREWKNVIGEVDKTAAYSRIMALSPVEYTWKPEHRPDTDNTELIGFNVHRGFIAEDVEAVDHVLAQYGWLYHEGDGDGDKTGQPLTEELGRTDQTLDDAVVVSYDSKAMFADLVAAVQYLAGRVEELEGAM
jgi:hypothetical protein